MAKFEFSQIRRLLRKREDDEALRNFLGDPAVSNIARDAYYGFLEFKSGGVDVVFKEAPWVLPAPEITQPKALYLSAFHLHGPGHEGFAGYSNPLPNGIAFGHSETEILTKMGTPKETGGGKMSTALKGMIPRWLLYSLGDADLQLQFDKDGRLEMVTLSAPKVPLSQK